MTVLVTGGSGLVGSHVIEALRSRGTSVRALVRPASRAAVERLGADAVPGDVTDPAAWRAAALGVRGIVHAAAVVQRRCSWERYLAVNVEGTRLATLAADTAGARLVHISSVAVYGGSGAYGIDPERRGEDSPFLPIVESDFYARSKRMAEALVREAAGGGLSTVALRPNVVYGERDRLFTPRLSASRASASCRASAPAPTGSRACTPGMSRRQSSRRSRRRASVSARTT